MALIALPVLGQTAKAPPAAHKFTPPHTWWGDPDLQGWFTNENEDGTPLERPDQFAGRKLEDVWVHLEVKDVDGKVANRMVEGGPPNALLRRGFTKKILPEGAEIVVDGYQSKDGALRANAPDITFADGKKLFVGSSAPVGSSEPSAKYQSPTWCLASAAGS